MTSKKPININSVEELTCSNKFGTFFGVPQSIFDQVWQELSSPKKNSVAYVSMEIGADPDIFHPVQDFLKEEEYTTSPDPTVQLFLDKYLQGPRKIPNYSGGLGVLAGDTLKSFADTHIPVIAISLLYREGYFSQLVDSRVGQIDQATSWSPEATPTLFQLQDPENPGQPLEITVPFFNEYDHPTMAKAHVWMKMEVSEELDFFVPEFLLDYSIPSSPPWVREAGLRLYNAKSAIMKANQRRMLGSGILPLTEALGLTPHTIHLNEQHGVAVTLHLILRQLKRTLGKDLRTTMRDEDIMAAAQEVARQIVYTIHTPVKAGHDRFARSLYTGISHETCHRILDLLAHDSDSPHEYNFTAFAMRVNRAINSVSRLHRDVTRKQFPDVAEKIKAITNGVHHLTWISEARAELFDTTKELEGWRDDPGVFAHMQLPDEQVFRKQLQQAWHKDNEILIDYINTMLSDHRTQMDSTWIDPPNYLSHLRPEQSLLQPDVFTVGFARRFSTYKRADLIFDNMPALADILVKNNWRINFIFAGKAHPQDEPGKSVLKLILDNQEELYTRSNGLAQLIFVPGYDMQIAKMMVSGVHTWLNSPKRPLEASGTSGMKAAMNGVPNLSVMDGWWVEGYHEGATGWKFGYDGPLNADSLSEHPDTLLYAEDSQSFYQLLPKVLELFYERHDEYMQLAVNNLRLNVPIFNTHRMAAEYVRKYNLDLPEETSARMKRFQNLYQSEPSDA
ncbi:MAG: alpha-glucan family phosphorylase [Candidatus Electrothrix aestuarii]|uniref:glycogen phosphorylase n=1 Tax=Candidatus Electrothrix aestuarii TaxID=3062594 RepID=A0AAU8LV41_9BACT|nr:alpha-glucan family phosphorylase [Candidatus Electrothrix aestuarii]